MGVTLNNGITSTPRCGDSSTKRYQSSSAASAYPPYEKPQNVELWEKLANKELSRSKKTVDTLRTERVTPEGIAIQPVYYDLDDPEPAMPVST